MEHAPRVGACKRRCKEGSFGGNLGHGGQSEQTFRLWKAILEAILEAILGGLKAADGGSMGHGGQSGKQSGSWGAADGGSMGQWGQPEGSLRLQGSIGEGMCAVFCNKCSFYRLGTAV